MNRRVFINKSAFGAGIAISSSLSACTINRKEETTLQNRVKDIVPIKKEEREQRINKAQRLMKEQGINALLLDAGTSLQYFTGISWWPSERPMLSIIPSEGDIFYICPAFEQDRLKEKISIDSDIHVWNEDESPYRLLAKILSKDLLTKQKIAIEERVRFFIFNGIQKELPKADLVSAEAITIPCRIIKSAAEIALIQRAMEITTAAIKIGFEQLYEGCSPAEFSKAVASAHTQMGAVHQFASVNFAEASALPHGSGRTQILKPGDVVLVDCGCTVEGYNSDISRTIVYGQKANDRQIEIWNLEKKAQSAGYSAAQVGKPLHEVDDAARQVIIDAGFGPGYNVPGLPHRTGHGIGMDGHEWGNAVKGNQTVIEPGMCFSIEPTIAIPGEFGVRLEDCVYITEIGPVWFSEPSPSIDKPFSEN